MGIEKLYEFKQTQILEHVPVITDDVLNFINVIIKSNNVKNILEIGTATGVSAMFFCEYMNDGIVTTIERDERMYFKAVKNIKQFGMDGKIKVILADAQEALRNLDGLYDMIFLDGAKSHYIHMLEDCIRLIKHNGLILADNVSFRGMVTGQSPQIRRKITIIKRLRSFLDEINKRQDLVSCVLPIGDGLGVSVKI